MEKTHITLHLRPGLKIQNFSPACESNPHRNNPTTNQKKINTHTHSAWLFRSRKVDYPSKDVRGVDEHLENEISIFQVVEGSYILHE